MKGFTLTILSLLAVLAFTKAQLGGGLLSVNALGNGRRTRDRSSGGLLGVNIGNGVQNPRNARGNNQGSLLNIDALGNNKKTSSSSSSLAAVNVGDSLGVKVLPTYRRDLVQSPAAQINVLNAEEDADPEENVETGEETDPAENEEDSDADTVTDTDSNPDTDTDTETDIDADPDTSTDPDDDTDAATTGPVRRPCWRRRPYGRPSWIGNRFGRNRFGRNRFGRNRFGRNRFGRNRFGRNRFGRHRHGRRYGGWYGNRYGNRFGNRNDNAYTTDSSANAPWQRGNRYGFPFAGMGRGFYGMGPNGLTFEYGPGRFSRRG